MPCTRIQQQWSSRAAEQQPASMFSPIFAKKTKLLRTQYTKSEAIRECFKLTRGFTVGQRVCFVHSIQRTLAEPNQGRAICLFCLHWVNTRVYRIYRHRHKHTTHTYVGTEMGGLCERGYRMRGEKSGNVKEGCEGVNVLGATRRLRGGQQAGELSIRAYSAVDCDFP